MMIVARALPAAHVVRELKRFEQVGMTEATAKRKSRGDLSRHGFYYLKSGVIDGGRTRDL